MSVSSLPKPVTKMATASKNVALAKGVWRLPRHKVYKNRHLYKRSKFVTVKPKTPKITTREKTVGGDKNGGSRKVALQKSPRYYPTEPKRRRLVNHKRPGVAKLRKSIKPGTVLVLLSGKYRGKRVVFLKQLSSGLLLVTGPFKINGVPIRRVNQAYVLATSARVNISKVTVDNKFNDHYFKHSPAPNGKKGEKDFKKQTDAKKKVAKGRVADQKEVDTAVLSCIKEKPLMRQYLKAPFTLTNGQYPHRMKF